MDKIISLLNKILVFLNLRISKTESYGIPKEFKRSYRHQLRGLKKNREFHIWSAFRYDIGAHPVEFEAYQCEFAAHHINRLKPKAILDIGSYRQFILGIQSSLKVTTIDVRKRMPATNNEIVVTCDAKKINLPDNSFDAVVSLCALEHFGLGRYGDEFELDADKKAFKEMIRVLKPNGRIIFTTMITNAGPSIAFNAHRLYTHKMIEEFCSDLICEEERFYNPRDGVLYALKDVVREERLWDVYCGCWIKK